MEGKIEKKISNPAPSKKYPKICKTKDKKKMIK